MINDQFASRKECVYIGDSTVDAETARNANISFIPVLTGTTKEEDFGNYSSPFILNNVYDIIKHKRRNMLCPKQ
ncbi:MAG: HAD hydrolase-like protein [Spirochaetia bacterium]